MDYCECRQLQLCIKVRYMLICLQSLISHTSCDWSVMVQAARHGPAYSFIEQHCWSSAALPCASSESIQESTIVLLVWFQPDLLLHLGNVLHLTQTLILAHQSNVICVWARHPWLQMSKSGCQSALSISGSEGCVGLLSRGLLTAQARCLSCDNVSLRMCLPSDPNGLNIRGS